MTVLRNNCSSTNEIHHDDIGELMILVDFLATLTILACLVIWKKKGVAAAGYKMAHCDYKSSLWSYSWMVSILHARSPH